MKLVLKTVSYAFLSLVGLVVLIVMALQVISNEQYKAWAVAATGKATGRELLINGGFDLHFGTTVRLLARDIHFANAGWGAQDDMLSADRLFVELRLLPLLKGVLDCTVELDRPAILMETNEQGRGNWVFGTSEEVLDQDPDQVANHAGESFTLPVKPYVRNLEIKGLTFALRDAANGQDIRAGIEVLRLFVDGNDMPLFLRATYQNAPIELTGTLGRIDDWHANQQTPISLQGNLNGARVQVEGTGGPIQPQPAARLDLSLAADTLATFSPFAGISLPDLKGLDIAMTTRTEAGRIRADKVHGKLQDPKVTLSVDGTVADLVRFDGIELHTAIQSEQVQGFAEQIGIYLPVGLPTSMSLEASASGSLDQVTVSTLQAVVKDKGMELHLTGSAENLFKPSGVEVNVQANIQNTARLSKFSGLELPDLGSLTMAGQVLSAGEALRLDNLDLQLKGEALDAQLKGGIKDLLVLAEANEDPINLGAAGIDISLQATVPSVAELAEAAGVAFPELGSLQFGGQLISGKETLALERAAAVLEGEGWQARISGAVQDVVALQGVKATITGNLASLVFLSPLTEGGLPQTGPWSLNGQVQSDSPLDSPMVIEAHLDGEGIQTVVAATVPKITSPQTFQAEYTVEGESIASLDALFGKALPREWPLKILGKVTAQPGHYRVDAAQVVLGQGKVSADLTYTAPQEGGAGRPMIAGWMSTQDLDLTPLFAVSTGADEPVAQGEGPAQDAEGAKEDKSTIKPDRGRRVFSSAPLAMGVLQVYDIDLKLDATNLTLAKSFPVDSSLAVRLNQGLLTVDQFNLTSLTGGNGEGVLTLDARSPEASMDINFDGKELVLPGLGGGFGLTVDLDGRGQSIAAMMGSLNGQFIAALHDVPLNQSSMTKLGTGLLTRINPLKNKTTVLECAIVRFDAKDGMVDLNKKIAAQTTEVTWIGGGKINLKTEKIDIDIVPKPRSKLSSLTSLGLAELVHISGTLGEPKVGFDTMGAAKKYAGYAAFIATSGLSFLGSKMLDSRTANMNHCERILAEQKKE